MEPGKQGNCCRKGARRLSGFTLIEMLVVMAFISILASLVLVGIQKARKSGEESAAKAEIQMLCARINNFRNEFGYYPPTSLSDIKVKGNGINDGNESLFVFLLTRKRGGPFADDLKEDRWANADGDDLKGPDAKLIAKEIDCARGTDRLLEYLDLWGSPYVYINSKDYGKKFKYQSPDGTVFEAEARKNPTTGTYCAPSSFQLWSVGPDGISQNGEGDDIASWK